MSIPPLPPSIVSSIAGTSRAALQRATDVSQGEPAPVTVKGSETVDSIDKGQGSNDSEADGRQLLDTFERRNENEVEKNEVEKNEGEENEGEDSQKKLARESAIGDGAEKGHIDFTA
jgi:hypothetical protein